MGSRSDQRLVDLDVITSTMVRVSEIQEYDVLTGASMVSPKKLITDELSLNTKIPLSELPFRKRYQEF